MLFEGDFPKRGIEVTSLPITDLAGVKAAIKPNTRVIFAEFLSNPWNRVTDVPALAKIAHDAKAILIIDNTFLSPAAVRPLSMGADLVLHASTKWISGHGDALGGVVHHHRQLVGVDAIGAMQHEVANLLRW